MLTALITLTGTKCPRKEKYTCFGEDKVYAKTMKEMRRLLAERYGKSWKHRSPVYRDKVDGSVIHIGYVVGYRNADYSHAPVEWWYQQDWISFKECKDVVLGAA